MDTKKAARSIQRLVASLIAGDAAAAVRNSTHSRLSPTDIRQALAGYPYRPVSYDVPIEQLFDWVPVQTSNPARWNVNLPLWTKEEGRSDLTLQLTVIDTPKGDYDIELDDLHVL